MVYRPSSSPCAASMRGGLAGGLAAKAREELEATTKTTRKGKGVPNAPMKPPSVASEESDSVFGGAVDKKEMRARTATRNKARTEALRHKSRMVSAQGLGAANPVFTDQDPLWNVAWQVVNPRHRYVQWWDLMTLHLLVFTALVTPYEIAFLDGLTGVGADLMFWVNQVINVIFLADMVLVFITPFEDNDGVWVTSKQELAARYFKGMFVIDLMSIMPFDIIEALGGGGLSSLKVLRVLKLFRLLKMLRIFRGLKIVRKYEADFAINYQALSISMLLLVLLVTAHWIACLLALICKYDPLSPALEVFLPNMIEMDEEITRFKQYYYCFLWGLMFMTIGMGEGHDGKEESSVLRAYISILLIVGAVANAAIIGGVVAIVDEMNEASREFYSNLNVLNVFLKREDVYNRVMKWRNDEVPGPEFCRRLRSFYLFKFSHSKQYSDLGRILDNVSADMRRVVSEAMFGDVLRSCGILKHANADMIAHLSANIEVQVYARGDFVYTAGEPATQFYFCVKGCVMLPMRGGNTAGGIDVFRRGGEPFGMEVVYKLGEPRSRSAVCSVGTVLLVLDGEALHHAMNTYGEHSMRWRVIISRNVMMISSVLKKAAHEATRVPGECNADAAIAFVEFSLGKTALFNQDLAGRKENNLLSHLTRLVYTRLKEQGMRPTEVKRAMDSFRKHEDYFDECTDREVIATEKVEDLRHLLDAIEDEDGESMEIHFEKLCEEKIETIESLKALAVCDLKAIGVPLGDAVLIAKSLKTPMPGILDALITGRRETKPETTAARRVSVRRDIRSVAKARSFGSKRKLDVDLDFTPEEDTDREDRPGELKNKLGERNVRKDERDDDSEEEKRNDRLNLRGTKKTTFAEEETSSSDDMQIQASACWTPTASDVFGGAPAKERKKSLGRQL